VEAPDSNPLSSGRAFADLSSWRKIAVSGTEATPWLNGLVSADVGGLLPGKARRSLLLSPTGRVRAEFTVAARDEGLLLIQDPIQHRSIGELLAPYVLSADVGLEDRTTDIALFAFPGRSDAPAPGASSSISIPSCLGAGVDLLASAERRDQLMRTFGSSFDLATEEEVEGWRVSSGLPRFGVDALEDDLPQEAGLDGAVAFDKGCYLGQEAVAKVRNLGHPRRLVVRLASRERVRAGEAVLADGQQAGVVTSALADAGGSVLLARIVWDARDLPLRTASGGALDRAARPGQPSRPV